MKREGVIRLKKSLLRLLCAVLALCLLTGAALGDTWYVYTKNGKTLNLRSEYDNSVIGYIPFGTPLTPDEEKSTETSAYVTYGGQSGYVRWNYLVRTKPTKNPDPTPVPEYIMKNGSKGDEVQELQDMLIDMGFLDGSADGKYGTKTAGAVKKFHAWVGGNSKDGSVTQEDLDLIEAIWSLSMGEYSENLPDNDTWSSTRACCYWDEAGTAVACGTHWIAVTCRHYYDCYSGTPDALALLLLNRCVMLWEESIVSMMDELEETDPNAAVELRIDYEAKLMELEPQWETDAKHSYPNKKTSRTIYVLLHRADWLQEYGIRLCFQLHAGEEDVLGSPEAN